MLTRRNTKCRPAEKAAAVGSPPLAAAEFMGSTQF